MESPPGVSDFQWDRLAPIPLLLNSLLTQGPRSGCFYGLEELRRRVLSKPEIHYARLLAVALLVVLLAKPLLPYPASSQAVPKFAEASKRQRSISTIDICNHARTMPAVFELFGYPAANGGQRPEFRIVFD